MKTAAAKEVKREQINKSGKESLATDIDGTRWKKNKKLTHTLALTTAEKQMKKKAFRID